jgi:gamma-glutamyltranspeptidase/glutathione hydrolase
MVPEATCRSPKSSETVYVTAVDQSGNAASFISSIYMAFGSGMVVDNTGIVLQNRGHSFSLDPTHPNKLEPHKRPLHTIIPAMVFEQDRFVMSFGVMGGDMQPQGHAQFLINLIDFEMNPQQAVDAPPIRHMQEVDVYLEEGIPDRTSAALRKKGHRIIRAPEPVNQVGGGGHLP